MTPTTHINSLPRDWTAAQDWTLWSGLGMGYGIIAISHAVGKTVADVGARFHAITEPFKVGDLRHVPLDAQLALGRALRGRLN